jgi:T4 gene Gp59 loader of gp41 DNA helicase/T4 gene Gp59 loader of gp41 DNA helicase C-term
MTIHPYDAYAYYMAIKLHYERDSYDALKYNFKTSANPQSFQTRKDKYFFAKLAKKFDSPNDLIGYYVSNFMHGSKWVGELLESGDDNYFKWKKYHEALKYRFSEDIGTLVDYIQDRGTNFDSLFTMEDDEQHPPIVKLLIREQISVETVVLLDKMIGFVKRLDKQITETLVWPEMSIKIKKTKPFVNADIEELKKIVLQKFA